MQYSISSLAQEVTRDVCSSVFGIDARLLEKLMRNRDRSADEKAILDNFDLIKTRLTESQEIVETVLADLESQRKVFEQQVKEAEISRNIAELNESEVAAMNAMLDGAIEKGSKKSSASNIFWGLVFCLLSTVLGFALGKLF